jgi:putative aminopeptidase FrvX
MPKTPHPPGRARHNPAGRKKQAASRRTPSSSRRSRTPDLMDLARRLSEASGVSGDESEVRRIVLEALQRRADQIKVDALGNILVCPRASRRRGVRVMVSAHLDEVGLMVVAVTNDGMLQFEKVGAVDERYLLGKAVWVGKDHLPGVIGVKPMHLAAPGELASPVPLDSLRIDIGASSQEAARKYARPGDRVSFATSFEVHGSLLMGKALDGRLGVASLISLTLDPPGNIDLLAAFTTQEEVGLRGARVAAYSLKPQAALVLDTTPALDLPSADGSENTTYNCKLGAGPVLYLADRGTLGDRRLISLVVEAARAEGLPFQVRQPGGDPTEAAAIHLTREGIPSVSLSIPGRYLHTPRSLARLDDWLNTVRLARAALSRMTPDRLR